MKKVLSIVLAIAMIATMSVVAFAGSATLGGVDVHEIPAEGLAQSITVMGDYNDQSIDKDTYKVDLSWNDLTLTYNDATVDTWNPETHTWVPAPGGEWLDGGKGTVTVTVVNHSSKSVKVELAYADAEGGATTTATDAEAITVLAPEVGAATGVTGTIASEVTAEGPITTDGALGTFTVTVKAV